MFSSFNRSFVLAPTTFGLVLLCIGCQVTTGALMGYPQNRTEAAHAIVDQIVEEILEQAQSAEAEALKIQAEGEKLIAEDAGFLEEIELTQDRLQTEFPDDTLAFIKAQEARLEAIDYRDLAATAHLIASLSTDQRTREEWLTQSREYDKQADALEKQADGWEQFIEARRIAEAIQHTDALKANIRQSP